MASMRVFQLGLRRAAVPNFTRFQPAGRMVQRRFAATQNAQQAQGSDILVKQRLLRPVSPHLTIYRPQITWYASMCHRLTGVILSAGLYLFGFAYLAAPSLGWHLETPSMVAAVAGWSVFAKVSAKLFVAWPFFFHCINGVRHLSWDFGLGFKNKMVIQTGWSTIGLAAVLGLYYTFAG